MQFSSQDLLDPGLVIFLRLLTLPFPFFGIIDFFSTIIQYITYFTNDIYFFPDNDPFGELNVIGGQVGLG